MRRWRIVDSRIQRREGPSATTRAAVRANTIILPFTTVSRVTVAKCLLSVFYRPRRRRSSCNYNQLASCYTESQSVRTAGLSGGSLPSDGHWNRVTLSGKINISRGCGSRELFRIENLLHRCTTVSTFECE